MVYGSIFYKDPYTMTNVENNSPGIREPIQFLVEVHIILHNIENGLPGLYAIEKMEPGPNFHEPIFYLTLACLTIKRKENDSTYYF